MSHVSFLLSLYSYGNLFIDKRSAFEFVREFMNTWYDNLDKIKSIIFQMNTFLYTYDIKLFQIKDIYKMNIKKSSLMINCTNMNLCRHLYHMNEKHK